MRASLASKASAQRELEVELVKLQEEAKQLTAELGTPLSGSLTSEEETELRQMRVCARAGCGRTSVLVEVGCCSPW